MMKYEDITQRIIGCAMRAHSTLGKGFQEVIYQRCLDVEMSKERLNVAREVEMPVYYNDQEVGTRRADFVVENCVMIELKALINTEDVHLAQALNYLEAYNLEVGLLINFGSKSMEFKRLYNKKYRAV